MKLHLPATLSLFVLCASVHAELVTVGSWTKFMEAAASGASDIHFDGQFVVPDDVTQKVLFGNNVNITGAEENLITVGKCTEMNQFPNIIDFGSKVGGSVSGLNFTGDISNRQAIIHAGTSNSVTISSCTFSNMSAEYAQMGTGGPYIVFVEGLDNTVEECKFLNNTNAPVYIRGSQDGLGTGKLAKLSNCEFSGNSQVVSFDSPRVGVSSILEVQYTVVTGCSFIGNSKKMSSDFNIRSMEGGAVSAAAITKFVDSSFSNNFVMMNSQTDEGYSKSRGGAIYAWAIDGMEVDIGISAQKENVVFSGNKMGVTQLDGEGKALNGVANAIWVENTFGSEATLRVSASEGKSVEFLDPVVMLASVRYPKEEGEFTQQDFFLNENEGDTGTVIFSGELYKDDNAANRASCFSNSVGITQKRGKVQITQQAIVGSYVDDESRIHTTKIGALNYVQNKGVLEISSGGHLMAGSFHVAGDGSEDSGFNLCTLAVGDGATLTTGWAFMDKGVTFDLQLFSNLTSGLKVNIVDDAPNSITTGTPIYDLAGPRVTLGGTLGIANTLNYNEARWNNTMDFLLFDFSGRSDAQTLTGDFTGIEIAGTNSSKVNGRGGWSLKWNDEAKKDKLYAVWTPTGESVPEPSSAMLAMLGLGALVLRRRRTA